MVILEGHVTHLYKRLMAPVSLHTPCVVLPVPHTRTYVIRYTSNEHICIFASILENKQALIVECTWCHVTSKYVREKKDIWRWSICNLEYVQYYLVWNRTQECWDMFFNYPLHWHCILKMWSSWRKMRLRLNSQICLSSFFTIQNGATRYPLK